MEMGELRTQSHMKRETRSANPVRIRVGLR